MYNEHVLARLVHFHDIVNRLEGDYRRTKKTYSEVSWSYLADGSAMARAYFLEEIGKEMGLFEPELAIFA